MKVPEIEIDYKKTKKEVLKAITHYKRNLMKIYRLRKPIYTSDYKLTLPNDSEKQNNSKSLSELEEIIYRFHKEINNLEELDRIIFIKSILEKCSDIKVGLLTNYSASSIRDKRTSILVFVAFMLECVVVKEWQSITE